MISTGTILTVIAAGIAVGVPGLCSVIGIKSAGVTGAAAVTENKDNFKNALILQALPQTQTIYGFIIALFIIMGGGLLGTPKDVSMTLGWVFMASSFIIAATSVTAIFQGLVSSSGIAACTKNPKAFVPSLVFSGQCETPAIFGFIAALIILVVGLGVLG